MLNVQAIEYRGGALDGLPDEQLVTLAAQGRLSQPAVLEQQVRRMLADPRSRSLVANFAGQWLHLRNLDAITPEEPV